ncbi:enoyl-CoA hydratase/isomerase family protein [Natrialbaceae archaeon A-chndr2]
MIEVDDGEGIRTILLDRPTRRNALTPDGLEALESAVAETPHSVIFLEGAGPAFCAGADLDVVAGLDRDGAEAFARLGQRVANAIADSDAVVVAGIDGPARGGGLELALACDIRVGTPEATLGEPGVTFGLFGAWGGTVRLPRIVGEGVALELACTGRVLEAEEALRVGLLSRLEDEPRTVAETIVEYPTDTLAVLQSRIRDRADRATQEEREALAFGALVESHGEAISRRFG